MKLEEGGKENTFLRGEDKDLAVLLNAKIQTSSHSFKKYTKERFLQESFDTQIDSLANFQSSSAKRT